MKVLLVYRFGKPAIKEEQEINDEDLEEIFNSSLRIVKCYDGEYWVLDNDGKVGEMLVEFEDNVVINPLTIAAITRIPPLSPQYKSGARTQILCGGGGIMTSKTFDEVRLWYNAAMQTILHPQQQNSNLRITDDE